MAPHRPVEPEPVEIVLVALDGAAEQGTDSRPPPAGIGTMPPITQLVGTVINRVADVPDPPLLPGSKDRPVWSDQRVHRLVRLPPWDATVAMRTFLETWDGRTGPVAGVRARRRLRTRISRHVRLVLEPASTPSGPIRLDGELHVDRWSRPTPVVLTLEPWSAQRTGLCLRPHRGRFGVHLPRRYYDVAHLVMDEVWHQVERTARDLTSPRRRAP